MGVEGRDRARTMDMGAHALSGQLGKTIQRLRKAYNLSLSELAEQVGVAKSIISQIERNETNPTLATIWRLSQALDVSIERVLSAGRRGALHRQDHQGRHADALFPTTARCGSAIIGWIKTVEWLQWYDVQAEPGGVLDSDAHQRGSIESLSVIEGELEVEVGDLIQQAKAGETLRYRCDRHHIVRNVSRQAGHATMVCILKAAVMD